MIYELVLWVRGVKQTLGFFKTKKEAEAAKREAKEFYRKTDSYLQGLLFDGGAGYEIHQHEWGYTKHAKIEIDCGKEWREG